MHTDKLMMVVIDFEDGPAAKPDTPHTSPHEQVTYVAEGEVLFLSGKNPAGSLPGTWLSYRPISPTGFN